MPLMLRLPPPITFPEEPMDTLQDVLAGLSLTVALIGLLLMLMVL